MLRLIDMDKSGYSNKTRKMKRQRFEDWMSGFVQSFLSDSSHEEEDCLANRYMDDLRRNKYALGIIHDNRSGYLCGTGLDYRGYGRYFFSRDVPEKMPEFVWDIKNRCVEHGYTFHGSEWRSKNVRGLSKGKAKRTSSYYETRM